MKAEQFFIGDIRECTKYEMHTTFSSSTYIGDECLGCDSIGYTVSDDALYKKDAVLVKVVNGGYVDIDSINSIFDFLSIRKDISDDGFSLGGLIMSTSAAFPHSLFVDEKTLKPYYAENNKQDDVSVFKLKKQIRNK